MLTACNTKLVPSVGQADNAIVLSAGISEGPAGVQTKAEYNPEASHGSHVKFTQGTALTLRIDGVWKDKADGLLTHGSISSENVTQTTTASIGTQVLADGKHNDVTFTDDQRLYWDDYGSADPANMSTSKGGTVSDGSDGRGRGLDIFAVAVDNVQDAPTVSSWIALPWNVGSVSDGAINQKSGWSTKDLLTSNNVKKTNEEETNNPYKFDDRAAGKLLAFTHAMTKVTVNLTANEGFPGYPSGAENAKFQEEPKVTLLGFNYTGKVNIETKTTTATDAEGTNTTPANTARANFSAHREGSSEWAAAHIVTYNALVFPGNQFSDATKILKIEADGNIYYVDASKINVANTEEHNTFEQAKEYIFNITVNKTSIDVTATIKDWVSVSAANEAPVINVTNVYGYEGTAFSSDKSFSFLRSTAKTSGYSIDAQMNYVNSPKSCTLVPTLYWPDHSTHYFFRATWPLIADTGTAGEYIPTSSFIEANAVAVANEKFNAGHYPSEIMLGYPRVSDADGSADETCKVGHKESDGTTPKAGICATQGKINMDFRYAMSQVIVELKTNTAEGATNSVEFNEHTVVEIIDGFTSGKLLLADGSSDFTDKTIEDYTMNRLADDDHDSYKDAIIPQSLTNGTGESAKDLKFRISVGNGSGLDVYETVLGIKNIKVNGDEIISAWEPGKKYTYTLTITKTGIKVEAAVKDWIDVDAEEDIWL